MTAPKFKRLTPENRAAELIEAGLRVLAKGGITSFTVENICKAAGASRGLISHHFGGKDGLLAACYAAAYAPLLQGIAAETRLPALIDELLSDRQMNPESLNIWLALWGEIAINPNLRAAHLSHYDRYHAALTAAIARCAAERQRSVDAPALAAALISLLDGLWLEICIAPGRMTPGLARQSVAALLGPHLGPL